jgi:hypothetical protein
VSEPSAEAATFDVFLCHNSEDKSEVREIAQRLVRKQVKPWLDEEQIRPGTSWQEALGSQMEGVKSAAVFVGSSGIGPWQNQEIQALLNEFVKRSCAVIPVILPSAKTTPRLPWTLANFQYVDFRSNHLDPLKQLIWGITGIRPTEQYRASNRATSTEAKPLTQKERYVSPDEKQRAELLVLLDRMSETWGDEAPPNPASDTGLVSTRKSSLEQAVEPAGTDVVRLSSDLLEARDIVEIFDFTRRLLILGEPGSGKTTLLLELARVHLCRARADVNERIPVLLNLSGWKRRQSLDEWISIELSQKYRIPVKIARSWLRSDYLVLLTDGLDEVPLALQPDCVAAINEFIDRFGPSKIAVCCRLTEYRWMPERLKLNSAICIESLSIEEVQEYLARSGSNFAALEDAINTDHLLCELVKTPLFLSIMCMAFQGARRAERLQQHGGTPDDRRNQIFSLYLEEMFRRKGSYYGEFSKQKTIGCLSWLAGKMKEDSQSTFLPERIQPAWLDTREERIRYKTTVAFGLALIFGLPAATIAGLTAGLGAGLNAGIGAGLGTLMAVRLACAVESPVRSFVKFQRRTSLNFNLLRVTWLGGSWTYGLILTGLSAAVLTGSRLQVPGIGLQVALFVCLTGLIVGYLAVGSLNNISLVENQSWKWRLSSGFIDWVKVSKISPNQGIKLSVKNSICAFFVALLSIALIGALSTGLAGISNWLVYGLFIGLVVALDRGGAAVIKHYSLRVILWITGRTPIDFIEFLDRCSKLVFLKKVGGGYIFIHRMLLEYFADLPRQRAETKFAPERE